VCVSAKETVSYGTNTLKLFIVSYHFKDISPIKAVDELSH
jgi:hypothetical protein